LPRGTVIQNNKSFYFSPPRDFNPMLRAGQNLAFKRCLMRTSLQPLASSCLFDILRQRSLASFANAATLKSPKESVDQVFALFERVGNSDYIGEPVSSEEHALQAAYLGAKAGFRNEAIIAALLHDVGHLLGLEDPSASRMDDCGVVDHEKIGGDWLRGLGFSEEVSTLVRRHVDAKRYLCCAKPGYHEKLSDASKVTLGFQGGPMTPDEAKAFEKDELFKTILAMRHWDEGAKVAGKEVPGLLDYRKMMEDHIASVKDSAQ